MRAPPADRPAGSLPRALLALCLLPGCSDYGVIGSRPDPDPVPELAADPALLDLVSCGPSRHTVTLASTGTGPVTLVDVAVEGDGWTLITAGWPEVLQPRDTLAITVEALPDGTGGDALLSVEHTEGLLTVPLSAAPDAPPAAALSAPVDGAVVAAGAPLQLAATVADPEDEAPGLRVTWESDLDGLVASPAPDADGSVSHAWPAAGRSPGPHRMTLTVTDACDQRAVETVTICQAAGDACS